MNAPARYTALETEAARVRSFEVSWVHGLLQMPDYTLRCSRRCCRTARATRSTGPFELRLCEPRGLVPGPGRGRDVVFIEGPAGDTYENKSDVDVYKDALADVANQALDPEGLPRDRPPLCAPARSPRGGPR
jgi:hypothetical protein